MPAISIIMPLYNASKYLEDSILSIQRQVFKDFELICIDDGSSDDTLKILKRFQEKDKRIRIYVNEERRGAAYSRNRGMHYANGMYLSFLDGDDIFDEAMLEKAYQAMEQHPIDIVIFEYKHVASEYINHKQFISHSREYIDRYCRQPFSIKELMPEEFIKISSSPCNKLLRRKFIEDNELEFQTLSCANDMYFVCMAVMLACKIIFLDDNRVMVYARDHFEPTRISYKRDPMCTYMALEKIQKELIERNKFGELYNYFYYRAYFNLKNTFLINTEENDKKAFYDFLKKEGIDRLRNSGGEYYKKVDEYMRTRLECFENMDYASKWYDSNDTLKINLYRNKKRILDLFIMCKTNGMNIGIWGAGYYGEAFLNYIQQIGLSVYAVIDKSKDKQGYELLGYKICSPEDVCDDVQLIIVTGISIYEEVLKELDGRDIEVISLCKFLNMIV